MRPDRATRQLADQAGYTKLIEDAGGVLMTDTCSAIGRVMPKGTRVVALDGGMEAWAAAGHVLEKSPS